MNILDPLKKQGEYEILVLTLNLHTYQEEDALAKLNYVADVIAYLDIDLIAFQECAQHKDSPIIKNNIRKDNMAHIISSRLKKKYKKNYTYSWDWAHYGWNVWEEGVAVVSKTPLLHQGSQYISLARTTKLIDSRKVVYMSTDIPAFGTVDLYSAHLSWRKSETDQEQNQQVQRLLAYVNMSSSLPSEEDPLLRTAYPIICGDFNMSSTAPAPFNEGYTLMTNEYVDTYALIHPEANIPKKSLPHKTIADRGRIDFIFIPQNAPLEVLDSSIIFKEKGLGLVSDHQGVLTRLKKKK